MDQQQSELIEISGLWKQESHAGKTYLGGRLGGARVLIFANDHKEKDSQPDYRLFVTKRKRRDETTNGGDADSGRVENEIDAAGPF